MGHIKATFSSNYRSKAVFEGFVEPDGPTGYRFHGTLRASCQLNRSSTSFKNTVRIGHSSTSNSNTYLEFEIKGDGENTYEVEGSGTRVKNEDIDFRLGVNEGLSGQFTDGGKFSTVTGGPWQRATPSYTKEDSLGNITYDVRFEGHVRADGPTGWVLKGDLDASGAPGTMTTQYCRLGYQGDDGWAYEVVAINDTPTAISLRGTRAAGAPLPMCTGATSGLANIYQHGDTVDIKLPETF